MWAKHRPCQGPAPTLFKYDQGDGKTFDCEALPVSTIFLKRMETIHRQRRVFLNKRGAGQGSTFPIVILQEDNGDLPAHLTRNVHDMLDQILAGEISRVCFPGKDELQGACLLRDFQKAVHVRKDEIRPFIGSGATGKPDGQGIVRRSQDTRRFPGRISWSRITAIRNSGAGRYARRPLSLRNDP